MEEQGEREPISSPSPPSCKDGQTWIYAWSSLSLYHEKNTNKTTNEDSIGDVIEDTLQKKL